jgi:hypothetical protein
MKEKLTIISDDLNYDIITELEARKQLLILLGVIESPYENSMQLPLQSPAESVILSILNKKVELIGNEETVKKVKQDAIQAHYNSIKPQ